jgi:hypothetical protein
MYISPLPTNLKGGYRSGEAPAPKGVPANTRAATPTTNLFI